MVIFYLAQHEQVTDLHAFSNYTVLHFLAIDAYVLNCIVYRKFMAFKLPTLRTSLTKINNLNLLSFNYEDLLDETGYSGKFLRHFMTIRFALSICH